MIPIRAERSPYVEQPNGDIHCTVVIPYAHRARLAAAKRVLLELSELPGRHGDGSAYAMIDRVTALHRDPGGETITLDLGLDPQDDAAEPPSPDEKPTAQRLDVAGSDQSLVMAGALDGWEHPAAKHVREIYMNRNFQNYALERLARAGQADPFAAPMPTAIDLLRTAARAPTVETARSQLAALLDDYNHWCAANNVAPWHAMR